MNTKEYIIPQKKVIAGIKAAAIDIKETLAETRQCVKDMMFNIDNESLALLSIIDTELDREEKEVFTIIKITEKMEADIDTASEINFKIIATIATLQLQNLNAVVENGLAVSNALNAFKVNSDQ